MKNATLKAASIAALALLTASSVPLVRAQNIGGLLKKAKNKIKDAGNDPSRADDGAHRKDGQPSTPANDASTTDQDDNGPSHEDIEKQVMSALLKIAPKNTRMLIVGCKPTAGGSLSFKGIYVVQTAKGTRSGNFPAIPASIQAQFKTLRRITAQHNHPFDACRVNVPCGLAPVTGDVSEVGFNYFYQGTAEMGLSSDEDISHYKIPTATQALANARQIISRSADYNRNYDKSIAIGEQGERRAEAAAAKRAGYRSVGWKCTNCGHVASWPEKPGPNFHGYCPESKSHNWVRR